MKKQLCVIAILLIAVNTYVSAASPFLKPGRPIIIKILKHCDDGFGLCMLIPIGRVALPNKDLAQAEATYVDGKLYLNINKDNLQEELLREFESNSFLPVDDDLPLTDDVIGQLDLPGHAALAQGKYTIVKDAESFQVVITVVK